MSSKIVLLAVVCGGAVPTGALAQFLPVTPYLSLANSPFAGLSSTYFHIENFESGAISAPGLTASGGVVGAPGVFSDSVDGDDGAIDGSGNGGRTYFSNGLGSVFTFDFSAAALGGLPTHVGVVWTDVGNVTSGTIGVGQVTFNVFDGNGVNVGGSGAGVTLGDGSAMGGTAEDRFFGFAHLAGVSRIQIAMSNSTDWEVDHVQYALVPAPGAAGLLAGGVMMLARRRR